MHCDFVYIFAYCIPFWFSLSLLIRFCIFLGSLTQISPPKRVKKRNSKQKNAQKTNNNNNSGDVDGIVFTSSFDVFILLLRMFFFYSSLASMSAFCLPSLPMRLFMQNNIHISKSKYYVLHSSMHVTIISIATTSKQFKFI